MKVMMVFDTYRDRKPGWLLNELREQWRRDLFRASYLAKTFNDDELHLHAKMLSDMIMLTGPDVEYSIKMMTTRTVFNARCAVHRRFAKGITNDQA